MKRLQQVNRRMMVKQDKVTFFAAELAGFLQDVLGDAKLSKVMQKGGNFQMSTLAVIPSQQACDPAGNGRNSLSMQKIAGILLLHCFQQ